INECENDTCEGLEEDIENIEEFEYCTYNNNLYVFEKESNNCLRKFPIEYDINLVKIDGINFEQLSFGSLLDEVSSTDISHLVLLQKYKDESSQKYVIQKINGIFKDKNSNFYYIYKNDEYENIKVDISANSCSNNIGGLANIDNNVVLCLTEKQYMSISNNKNNSHNLLIGEIEETYSKDSPFTKDEENSLFTVLELRTNLIIDIEYTSPDKIYLSYNDNKLLTVDDIFSYREISNNIFEFSSEENNINTINPNVYMYNNIIYNFKSDGEDKLIIEIDEINENLVFQYDNNLQLDVLVTDDDFENGLDSEISDIKLIKCQNSKCQRINGYIRYDYEKALKCDLDKCEEIQQNDCTGNIGVIYSSGTFYVCSDIESSDYSSMEINQNNKNAFMPDQNDQSTYILLELNESGNIITFSISDGKYILYTDDGKINVMMCIGKESRSICQRNKQGFYIENNESEDLIYCDNEKYCDTSSYSNGYFINSQNNEVIICSDSICTLFTPGSSCDEHNNEIILDNEKLYYCHDNEKIDIIDSNYYLELSNINTNDIYPKISSGSDIILLYIDGFSVTQYITESNGICMEKNNKLLKEDKDCLKLSNVLYNCEDNNKSCIITYNRCNPEENSDICNGYYLANINEETGAGILYNCINSDEYGVECDTVNEAKGYFKSFDEDAENPNYIKCDGTQCIKLNIPTQVSSSCSSNKDLILNNSKIMICINSSEMTEFKSNKGELDNQFFSNKKSNIFGTKENGDYIYISIFYDHIVLYDFSDMESNIYMFNNKIYSITNNYETGIISINKVDNYGMLAFQKDENNHIVLISNEEFEYDLSYEYSKIQLYQCMINNECKKTKGFIRYSYDTVINCDFNTCNKVEISECSMNNNRIAYLDEDSNFLLCVKVDGNNYQSKEISIGTKNHIFTFESNSKYYLYISNENGYVIGLSTQDGNYLYDINDDKNSKIFKCQKSDYGSECYINTGKGYFLNNLNEKSVELIYCDDNKCQGSLRSDGYFINSSDKNVIKCSDSSCILLDSDSIGNSCTDNHNEVIYYNNSLYYCSGEEMITFSSTIKYYKLSNINASSIYPVIESGDDYILLKIDQYSVTQYSSNSQAICITKDHTEDPECNSVDESVYICKSTSKSCSSSANICNVENPTNTCKGYYLININSTTNEGTLYKCTNEDTINCQIQNNVYGYYKVTDENFTDGKYISCNGKTCKKIETPSYSHNNYSSCSSDLIGELIYNSGNVMICINSNEMVEFLGNNDDKTTTYIIDNSKSITDVFGPKNNEDIIPISVSYDYIIPKDISYYNQFILIQHDEITYPDFPDVVIPENNFSNDLSDILSAVSIYECINNNLCHKTYGYFYYGKDKSINIVKCDSNKCEKTNKSITCNANNSGVAYYDTTFKFCSKQNYDNPTYISKEIKSNQTNYIFSLEQNSDNYYLYISYKNSRIIGLSSLEGVFLNENDISGANNNDLVKCSVYSPYDISTCQFISDEEGYFLNLKNPLSNSLIFCDSENCKLTTQNNGYFINTNSLDAIICHNSICQLFITDSDCNNNNYKVINSDNELYYCLNEDEISFDEEEIYYEIPNINAKSVFPKIETGNDKILIKIDEYSVTQYTNSNGICITHDHEIDETCSSGDAIIYNCNSPSVSCTSNLNICDPKSKNLSNSCTGYYLVDINSTTNEGTLYKCINKEKLSCQIQNNVKGYFKVTDKGFTEIEYISCNGNTCKKIIAPSYSNNNYRSCSSELIGELIYSNGYVKMCINSEDMIEFLSYKDNDAVTYILDNGNTKNDIFGTKENGYFLPISVSYDHIILTDTSYLTENKYLINHKLYNLKSNNNIKTFTLFEEDQFVVIQHDNVTYPDFPDTAIPENNFSNDLSNIISTLNIYENKNGKYFKASGYFYFGKDNNISVVKCDITKCEKTSKSETCDSSNSGTAYYDTSFKFCSKLNYDNPTYVSKEIKLDQTYYIFSLINNSDNYYLYLSYKNSKIIGFPSIDGYYLSEDNIKRNNKNEVLKCSSSSLNSGNSCMLLSSYGYFFNSKNPLSNSLIFCNSENCTVTTQSNGYFINTYSDKSITCSNSECKEDSLNSYCSSSSNYKIIYSSGFKICINDKEITITEAEKYYELLNISISSIYPNVSTGKDTILIKVGNYSVIQYITGSNDICINENNTEDENCMTEYSNKYSCKSIKNSCIKTINICNPKQPTTICNGYYFETNENKIYNCIKNSNSNECDTLNNGNGYYKMKNYDFVKCTNDECSIIKLFKDLSTGSYCSDDEEQIMIDYNSFIYICIFGQKIKLPSESESFSLEIIDINENTKTENFPFDITNNKLTLLVTSNSITQIELSLFKSGDYIIGNQLFSIEGKGDNTKLNNKTIYYITAVRKYTENNIYGVYVPITRKEFSNDMSSFINDVKIVNCENGSCNTTEGYLKYKNDEGEKIIKCNKNKCDPNSVLEDCNTDIAYYQSGFKICIKNKESGNYDVKEVTKSSTFFIPSSLQERLDVYVSDKSGNYIALISIDGNYLDDNKLVICRNGICINNINSGYFIDSNNENSNKLLFCDEYNNCKYTKQSNGIFINTLKEAIECSNSICYKLTLGYSCSSNNYKVVIQGNYLYFCINGNEYILPSETMYIKAINIDAESLYPMVKEGYDTILLSIDKYSNIA
ncbi:hypothetical protein PIROE2DRAFT_9784, partial [Piromyces sp. E2]